MEQKQGYKATAEDMLIARVVQNADTRAKTRSPRTRSPIRQSAEKVEKAKTTINNIVMYYHDEVTHPDEVHEEHVVQLPYR